MYVYIVAARPAGIDSNNTKLPHFILIFSFTYFNFVSMGQYFGTTSHS